MPSHNIPNQQNVLPILCEQNMRRKHAYCMFRKLVIVPNNLFEDILFLNLSFNYINTLDKSSFIKYSYITNLDLSNNNVNLIETGTFDPLNFLLVLNLSYNTNLNIEKVDLFRYTKRLSSLQLSQCNLRAIPVSFLNDLPKLESLDLSFNNLSSIHIKLSSGELIGCINLHNNNLQEITFNTVSIGGKVDSILFTRNPIRVIDAKTIESLNVRHLTIGENTFSLQTWDNLLTGISKSKVRKLSVSNTNLTNITRHSFQALVSFNSTLEEINLSKNEICFISASSFSNITAMNTIILSRNIIVQIEPQYFSGIRELITINLSWNRIRMVNPDNFKWDGNIQSLDLSFNRLEYLSPYAFYGLQNLTHLDLQNNILLVHLYIIPLSGLTKLQSLNVINCNLKNMSIHAPMLKRFRYQRNSESKWFCAPIQAGVTFQHARKLEELDLSASFDSNCLTDYEYVSLFHGLQNLRYLWLSKNEFQFPFPDDVFSGLDLLAVLDLSSCRISTLDRSVFKGLTSLFKLDLRDNTLTNLPYLADSYRLHYLYIDRNELTFIREDVFHNISSILELTLSNNFITEFYRSTLEQLNPNIQSIDISGNPLVCNCDTMWLKFWLYNRPLNISNENKIICSTTTGSIPSMRGKKLSLFDPSKLCEQNIGRFLITALVLIGIAFIVLLLYHFRWKIRHIFFLLKLMISQKNDFRDVRYHDFQFDFNVMFTEDAEVWVQNQMKPFLDERLPNYNRNAIGDDDLILGKHYLDSVNYLVENSFKTILLLSRAAVRDHWFLLKMQIAVNHMYQPDNKNRVLLIFLENIPDKELPYLVRLCLSRRKPYIHWTEDETGIEYFWDHLMKCLTMDIREIAQVE